MPVPTIIFLPGFMCDKRLFEAQIVACERAGLTCIFAGLSHATSIKNMANEVLSGCSGPIMPVGLSMGGIVAMEMVRQAPERISHLALLNTTPYADKAKAQRKQQLAQVADGKLTLVMREELKPNYLAARNRTPERLELLKDMGVGLGEYVFASQCLALMGRKSSVDLLPKIECPSLVLAGKEDTVCPPDIHIEMASAIPNATLLILPNCGHLSTMERPDDVNMALLNLLQEKGNNRQENKGKPARLRLVK